MEAVDVVGRQKSKRMEDNDSMNSEIRKGDEDEDGDGDEEVEECTEHCAGTR